MRTSETHPLLIDELSVGNGKIGITFCPGKRGPSTFGAAWARDLGMDIEVIRDWGAEMVITLIEDFEFDMLSVPDLPEKMRAAFDWRHMPIKDVSIPNEGFEAEWAGLSRDVQGLMAEGKRIMVHCRGGLGRAGLVAARLLIDMGEHPGRAMARLRQARKGAIETREQEQYLWACGKAAQGKRIYASLLGGAIGDALGAEIEFWPVDRILQAYPDRFADIPAHDGMVGAITDDTQMTLFTAEGCIRAHVRSNSKGICHGPSVIHHALLRWYVTQGGKPQMKVDDTGLVADKRLHRRRAPGNTCLGSLREASQFGDPARNPSKGCGTIMRVAPVAFANVSDPLKVALESSALTHGHKTGQEAAGLWALLLLDVARGKPLEASAKALQGRFGTATDAALRAALMAPRDGTPESVASLGQGWVAEEAMAIALYACLSATDFEHGLRIAVTHSGDSDSTGAIAGNMLGLMFPDQVMTHRWTGQVECRDLIETISMDLAAAGQGQTRNLEDAYPGG